MDQDSIVSKSANMSDGNDFNVHFVIRWSHLLILKKNLEIIEEL